ncbi:hypothetical protein PC116_g30981 [Phytophthora cactorum]|nr:hypothetical protein PC116_g30981 [Phytophthora cactorum]
MILFLLLMRAMHWQDLLLILAALAFCCQCSCPGQTGQSDFRLVPKVDVLFRRSEDLTGIIASISVSNPFDAVAEHGVETFEPLRPSRLLSWLGGWSCLVVTVNWPDLVTFSCVIEAISPNDTKMRIEAYRC